MKSQNHAPLGNYFDSAENEVGILPQAPFPDLSLAGKSAPSLSLHLDESPPASIPVPMPIHIQAPIIPSIDTLEINSEASLPADLQAAPPKPSLIETTPPDTSLQMQESVNSLRAFLNLEYKSEIPLKPTSIQKKIDPQISQTPVIDDMLKSEMITPGPPQLFAREGRHVQKPAPGVKNHIQTPLNPLRIFLGLLQMGVDCVLFRPLDLLADLHFIAGREWGRLWKRTSWVVCLIPMVVVFPLLVQRNISTLVLTFQILASLFLAPFFVYGLGTSYLNRHFRGQASKMVIVLGTIASLFFHSGFIYYMHVQGFAQNLQFANLCVGAIDQFFSATHFFDGYFRRYAQKFPLPPAADFLDTKRPDRLPVPQSPQPQSPLLSGPITPPAEQPTSLSKPPHEFNDSTVALARLLFREEIPKTAQDDILKFLAEILVEKKGDAFLKETPEKIVNEIRLLLIEEFPFYLNAKTIRAEGTIPSEKELKTQDFPPSEKMVDPVGFQNAITQTTYAVKWRDLALVRDLLPSFLKDALKVTDLFRIYAPIFDAGEIFQIETRVLVMRDTWALIEVVYGIVPYIKINPENTMIETGTFRVLRDRNPTKIAQMQYLVLRENNRWAMIHFDPSTQKQLEKAYPTWEFPKQPESLRLSIKIEGGAPKNLVKPEFE